MMLFLRLALVTIAFFGCSAGEAAREQVGAFEAPLTDPIYFAIDQASDKLAAPATRALDRVKAATCLDIRVGPGQHSIRIVDKAEMPTGKIGHTGGTWAAARIRISSQLKISLRKEATVLHEVWHVLARTNGHVGGATSISSDPVPFDGGLDAEALTEICRMQDCHCFVPEL